VGVLAQDYLEAVPGKGLLVDGPDRGLVIGEQEGEIGTFHGRPAPLE
jgi:hypothetical protein